jgi:hypothetical protein
LSLPPLDTTAPASLPANDEPERPGARPIRRVQRP